MPKIIWQFRWRVASKALKNTPKGFFYWVKMSKTPENLNILLSTAPNFPSYWEKWIAWFAFGARANGYFAL